MDYAEFWDALGRTRFPWAEVIWVMKPIVWAAILFVICFVSYQRGYSNAEKDAAEKPTPPHPAPPDVDTGDPSAS